MKKLFFICLIMGALCTTRAIAQDDGRVIIGKIDSISPMQGTLPNGDSVILVTYTDVTTSKKHRQGFTPKEVQSLKIGDRVKVGQKSFDPAGNFIHPLPRE